MPDPAWFSRTRAHSDSGGSHVPPCSGRVTLHVYDANWSRASSNVNALLRRLGVGAFHVGVEVYSKEWSYAITKEESGVTRVKPGGHPQHVYREAVSLGSTQLMPDEVNHLVEKLGAQWLSHEYHPLRHNCCMFCAKLCQALGVRGLPEWVTRLQDTGLAIDKGVAASLPALPHLGFCQTQDTERARFPGFAPSTAEYSSASGAVVYLRLPPGWQVAYSTEHQRPYYYNRQENTSQWELPVDPMDCLPEVIEIGEL